MITVPLIFAIATLVSFLLGSITRVQAALPMVNLMVLGFFFATCYFLVS